MRRNAQGLSVMALLVGLALTAAPVCAQKERMDLVRAVTPSVVAVYTYDDGGELLARGSGFFTSRQGNFITAYHLLRDAVSGEIVTSEGEVLPIGSVLATDTWSDLALLATAVAPSPGSVPTPAFTRPRIGEEVLVVGGSLVDDRSFLDATVQSARKVPYTGEIFRLSDWAPAGSMGGPVVNRRGEIVGIIAHPVTARNGNLAVTADAVGRLVPRGERSLGSLTSKTEGATAGDTFRNGLSALWEGEYEEALSRFFEVLESDPDNVDAAFLAGFSLNRVGRHHNASRILRQVTRDRRGDVEAHYQLGLAYSKLGCFQDAAEQYLEIVRIAPRDIDARYKLGYAYSRLDWDLKAAETFKEIVALVCESGLPGEESCAVLARERSEEIIETYRRHIWTDNGEADIHYQRGLVYLALARRDLALGEYRSLKSRNPYQASRLYRLIRR